MSVSNHLQIKEPGGIFFYTCRIKNGKNIFIVKEYINSLIESLLFYEKKYSLTTFIATIMPNHLHWLFKLPESLDDPIPIYKNLKSFLSTTIINLLNAEIEFGSKPVLDIFKNNPRCFRDTPAQMMKSFKLSDSNDHAKHQVWH
jgi:REP element-mobilizing transposase RayT